MIFSLAAAANLGSTAPVFGCHSGESCIRIHTSNAVSARATAMMTCAGTYPNQMTKRGVKNADSAVPPMPAPKTPVAKPRRAGSYQALANGIPIAKVVPAIPRKNPKTSSST